MSGCGCDKLRQRPYAAAVFIYTLRDTGNLRLWYIKNIIFLRHDYHLRSSSYSYSLIFHIPLVKFKDCFSNNPACVARTLGKLSGCLPADASFIEQAFVCRLAGDNICVKALLLFELYNVKTFLYIKSEFRTAFGINAYIISCLAALKSCSRNLHLLY